MTRRRLLALPVLLALAVAGCARSDDAPAVATAGGGGAAPSASASEPLSDEDRQLRFAQCMRENGVDIPDPEPGEGFRLRFGKDTDPRRVQAALEKCRGFMPNGGKRMKLDGEQAERARQMAQCMRENGVPNFPDPDPDGMLKLDPNSGIDLDSPTFEAAREKCRQYAPRPGGGDR